MAPPGLGEREKRRLRAAAAQLRAAAAREEDPDERGRLLDAAAESSGLSLNGAATHRARPAAA